MNELDILLWSDGFWCHRRDHSDKFFRDEDFRVLPPHSEEWIAARARGPLPPMAR